MSKPAYKVCARTLRVEKLKAIRAYQQWLDWLPNSEDWLQLPASDHIQQTALSVATGITSLWLDWTEPDDVKSLGWAFFKADDKGDLPDHIGKFRTAIVRNLSAITSKWSKAQKKKGVGSLTFSVQSVRASSGNDFVLLVLFVSKHLDRRVAEVDEARMNLATIEQKMKAIADAGHISHSELAKMPEVNAPLPWSKVPAFMKAEGGDE